MPELMKQIANTNEVPDIPTRSIEEIVKLVNAIPEPKPVPVRYVISLLDYSMKLQQENTKLKALLTWRSVTQKPDVDGLYVVTKRDESSRWDKSYHLVRFKNGEWKLDLFSGGYVYSYFNVPIPAPEGETNDRVDETL